MKSSGKLLYRQDWEKQYLEKKGEQAYMNEKIQDHEQNLKDKQKREIELVSENIEKTTQIRSKENARIADKTEIAQLQKELKLEKEQIKELNEKLEEAQERLDNFKKSCKCLIM